MVQRPARLLRPVAAARLLLVAAGFAGLVGCGASNPVPGLLDPREDPRFKACLGDADGTTVAFEVEKGERWRDHFPSHADEAERFDKDALIVVFPSGWPGVILGEDRPPGPGHADLCYWYASREAAEKHLAGEVGFQFYTIYGDVDITGLRP